MQTVNMHQAKTHLSRLVEQAANGEPFVIAKAGKPMVKVVPIEAPQVDVSKRFGFMKGQITMADDFDFDGYMQDEIIALFEGEDDGSDKAANRA